MAMLDRLKDAARTTNSIEGLQPSPGPQRPVDLHGANPVGPSDAPRAAKKGAGDAKAPAYTTEPEAIARAYYVEDRGGERRFYDDYQRKNLAIRASDTGISTKREDLNTIRAMLTMAEARGWSEIKVAGTADFKREAWIEAQARGIAAQGHKASDLDRQEADRRRAERGQAPVQVSTRQDVNEVRPVAGQGGQAATGVSKPVQNTPPAPVQQREAEPSRLVQDLHGANRGPVPSVPQSATAPTFSLSARNLDVVAPAPTTNDVGPGQQPARSSVAPQPEPVPQQPAPANVDHRKALREATAELSPDGRLVLAAISEKIDRQMNKLNAEAKLETKAFAASELVKKERLEGPVVLSPELRKAATAPEPAQAKQAQAPQPAAVRQVEPQQPQRTRSR